MSRALIVLAATAALLAPAGAASAAPDGASAAGGQTNASCNNGKGGNYAWSGHTYNGKGNSGKTVDCREGDGEDPGDVVV
jgi:hypothetical protein